MASAREVVHGAAGVVLDALKRSGAETHGPNDRVERGNVIANMTSVGREDVPIVINEALDMARIQLGSMAAEAQERGEEWDRQGMIRACLYAGIVSGLAFGVAAERVEQSTPPLVLPDT